MNQRIADIRSHVARDVRLGIGCEDLQRDIEWLCAEVEALYACKEFTGLVGAMAETFAAWAERPDEPELVDYHWPELTGRQST